MSVATVAVIGGGPWGLALATAAARAGAKTWLYSRKERRRDGVLPAGVSQARDYREVSEVARLIILAVPSQTAGEVAYALGDSLDGRHFVVHGIRGLAKDTMAPLSELIRHESPVRRVGAIGGPVVAEDLAAGRPSVMVVGSAYPEVRKAVSDAFVTPTLRLYETDDLRGLEWASALVGCLMIGVGYAKASGFGAGLVAAFISRGVQEAGRIAAAAGGDERTLLGLAGYGDLLASVEQPGRPEIVLGTALAAGKTLDQAKDEAKLRIEALDLIPRVAEWAVTHKVKAPIFNALANGILAAAPVTEVVHQLMTSPVESFV
jgi:glycerol-3-phosphate dehydrogenase (NAD(P)+)